MKNGKQESFSQSSGSAPHQDKHASRDCGGNSGKHEMKRGTGQKGNKYVADHTPGVG